MLIDVCRKKICVSEDDTKWLAIIFSESLYLEEVQNIFVEKFYSLLFYIAKSNKKQPKFIYFWFNISLYLQLVPYAEKREILRPFLTMQLKQKSMRYFLDKLQKIRRSKLFSYFFSINDCYGD